MHPANALERFVTNNPTMLQGPLARLLPQSVSAINREGEPVTFTWGDGVERTTTLHSDARGNIPQRVLYHPGVRQPYVYDKNPTRTVNYWRSPVRKWDHQHIKTLQGAVRNRNLQRWEDVVITEYWEGGGNTMSMQVDMLQTLLLFMIEPPPLGEGIGWLPRDLSWNRHIIIPLTLTVGGQDFDLNALRRSSLEGAPEDMMVDQQVAFSFALQSQPTLSPSLLFMEGAL